MAGADLDPIAALLDQSLLKPLGDDRFFMLETLREYACEQIDAAGETETFALRHARYYASLCEALLGTSKAERNRVRVTEAPNVQAAVAFARADDDAELQLRLLTYGGQACSGRSLPEFREALADALRRPTADLVLRGRAAHRLGFEEYRLGEYAAAQATAEQALDLGEQSGTHDVIAAALDLLGIIAVTEGDFDRAREFHERALVLSRAVGDDDGAANALVNLGDAALVAGEYERAIELTSEAIEHERHGGGGDLQARWSTSQPPTFSSATSPRPKRMPPLVSQHPANCAIPSGTPSPSASSRLRPPHDETRSARPFSSAPPTRSTATSAHAPTRARRPSARRCSANSTPPSARATSSRHLRAAAPFQLSKPSSSR